MIAYVTVIEPVKRDRVGLLVGEDVSGGAFIAISKFRDGVLQFCGICRVEMIDYCWVICSKKRDSVTRITTCLGGPCACLRVRTVSDSRP